MFVTVSADAPATKTAHPDGRSWAHVVRYAGPDGDLVTYADTAREALGVLIDGYLDADEAKAAQLRRQHATRTAALYQGIALDRLIAEGRFSPADAGPVAMEVLLADKTEPLPIDAWHYPVTLYVVDALYAPHTATPLPVANVYALRTGDDQGYLQSLAELGLIEYQHAS